MLMLTAYVLTVFVLKYEMASSFVLGFRCSMYIFADEAWTPRDSCHLDLSLSTETRQLYSLVRLQPCETKILV